MSYDIVFFILSSCIQHNYLDCLVIILYNMVSVHAVLCNTVTCPPGQQDINDTCQQCPMGTYKEMAGPETCTPCGFQLTTNLTGSSNESDCNIGKFRWM